MSYYYDRQTTIRTMYNLWIAKQAAQQGYRQIVNLLIHKVLEPIYTNPSIIATEEAEGESGDIIDHYDEITRSAARGGHIDIVNDMIDRGANEYNRITANARSEARGGHDPKRSYRP